MSELTGNQGASLGEKMGPQSQRRLTLQERTQKLQSMATNTGRAKRKGGQSAIGGGIAFDPRKDCEICEARAAGRNPHRSHHPLCWNNKRTRGIASATTLASNRETKAPQKHFSRPLQASEKGSWRCSTKEAGESFFASGKTQQVTRESNFNTTNTTNKATTMASGVTAADFCKGVTNKLQDASFCKEHETSRAPLAMLAFAAIVVEKIICLKMTSEHF